MKLRIMLLWLLIIPITVFPKSYITNAVGHYFGGNLANFAIAKIFSLKHNIPFYYSPFDHSFMFVMDDVETKSSEAENFPTVYLNSSQADRDIIQNKHRDVAFRVDILAKCDNIAPEWVEVVRQEIQPKKIPQVNDLPTDAISVAVHVRKGNGGGQHYDGELSSLQIYSYDPRLVHYTNAYFNYPFDWSSYARSHRAHTALKRPNIDRVSDWETKLPPEQFYIDQLKMLADILPQRKIFAQIFTDDKDPAALVERIKTNVNRPNIEYYFFNNRVQNHSERICSDLYNMSRFDVLIRSQSYFSRAAELMGHCKVVIYPLGFRWLAGNILLMNHIVIKGNINNL